MTAKQDYPMALFNASGVSRIVKSAEERQSLDADEWRDSPAAFEKHPDYEAYKKANS